MFTLENEDKVTITDIKPKPTPVDSEAKLFNFTGPAGPASAEPTELAYADVDLSSEVETSDFDIRTVAIVGGIIVFKLTMLGLLLVSI